MNDDVMVFPISPQRMARLMLDRCVDVLQVKQLMLEEMQALNADQNRIEEETNRLEAASPSKRPEAAAWEDRVHAIADEVTRLEALIAARHDLSDRIEQHRVVAFQLAQLRLLADLRRTR